MTVRGLVSMTGFGASHMTTNDYEFDVTIKGINSRYLDVTVKSSRELLIDAKIRSLIKEATITRGKVEISIHFVPKKSQDSLTKTINEIAFDHYYCIYQHCLTKIDDRQEGEIEKPRNILGLPQSVIIEILRRPEVWKYEGEEKSSVLPSSETFLKSDNLSGIILTLVKEALLSFASERVREGAILARDIEIRRAKIAQTSEYIASSQKEYVESLSQRLHARINELISFPLDPRRLEQEVALLVQKSDIHEELVRVDAHLNSVLSFTKPHPLEPEGVSKGKKMEFFLQELQREFSTISAKSHSVAITTLCIEARSELEKMREQIQNIE